MSVARGRMSKFVLPLPGLLLGGCQVVSSAGEFARCITLDCLFALRLI